MTVSASRCCPGELGYCREKTTSYSLSLSIFVFRLVVITRIGLLPVTISANFMQCIYILTFVL